MSTSRRAISFAARRGLTHGRRRRVVVREYGFELSLCARLEAEREAIVSRQLGAGVADPGGRVIDAVLVEPGPTFAERTRITDATIPRLVLESDLGPGRARRVTRAIDASPEHAREVAERAADVGFLELERRTGGDLYARQVTRYPESWFGGLLGIENKPDLGSPGDLADQLRTDVSLGVVDRVILATASHVTGAHLNRIPEAVGVWQYRPAADGSERPADEMGTLEVVREPKPLPTTEPGVELLERRAGVADVEIVTAEAIAAARRRIAERAYGKGWRPDEVPACKQFRHVERSRTPALPHCEWKDEVVEPARDCGPACPGFDPGVPPAADRDADAERSARSPWVRSPEGCKRRQAGLDRFE